MVIQGKSQKMLFPILAALFSILLYSVAITAQAGTGSCEAYEFMLDRDGNVDRTQPLTVIKQDAQLYIDATSSNPVTEKDEAGTSVSLALNFNKKLKALALEGSRVQVKRISGDEPLGWVERSDLLCTLRPARGRSGLEKKLYIKTATAVQGNVAAVNAYPSPEQADCPAGGCRQLSRFKGYFIFDEEQDRYLLSDEYNLKDSSPLVGWVDKKDGFLWETAYGVRPREDLTIPDGEEGAGQEGVVCVYLTPEDAVAKKGCRPMLGGPRWFTYPDRIPVLDREGDFYKVAVPVAGVAGNSDEGQHIKLTGENVGIDTLQGMKKVDVFFLLDGTSSMGPYIDVVKNVVGDIVDTLSNNEFYKETKFRFGFRIYRDDYAGNEGIGEGLPLSSQCKAISDHELAKGRKKFESEMSRVSVSSNEKDDYEENLFGGIKQAVRDMKPCPNNTKLLFVIGDSGYSADKQRERGNTPINIASLVRGLRGDQGQGVKNIVTFFLQTPKNIRRYRKSQSYRQAYDLFSSQGKDILEGILDGQESGDAEINNYLLTTDDRGLSKKVIAGVGAFSRGDVINEILLDLRGGASLVEAINRLQGSAEYGNLPGLFWDVIKDGSCKHLGEQCEEKVYNTILEGYIPISDDLVEDVWLKTEDLERWKKILSMLEDIGSYSSTKQRTAFVIALTENLRQVLKGIYKNDQSLKDYIESRLISLPLRDNSPLFSYSYDSLMDKEVVSDCEISRLVTWVHNSKQMLDIVTQGTRRPVYTEEPYPGECTRSDGSEIPIPFIDGAIEQTNLGPTDDYRYDHVFQKVRIFWVPKAYLP